MNDERPDDSVEQKKNEKKCTTVEIVICTIILSICSFVLFVWLIVFPWACGGLVMAYRNTFPAAGHPGDVPMPERLFAGIVCLMAILYPMIFFPALAATVLRLKNTVLKYGSPILFASIPLFYVLILILLVAWSWFCS